MKRMSITPEVVNSFYDKIEKLREEFPELSDPARWFNCDETCMMPEDKSDKVRLYAYYQLQG